MAVRSVIRIDEEKCDGCAKCVTSCAEGAIAVIDGKARLVSEVYCDGLGACLGDCPQGAITIEERQAEAFDEIKVHEHLSRLQSKQHAAAPLAVAEAPHQCPGSMMRSLGHRTAPLTGERQETGPPLASELVNWPVQLALVSPQAPYLHDADLLLVADCVPFACADFHQRFMRGKPVIIGCPKLDQPEPYVQKLAQILHTTRPKSLTVVRMEVPCCGGLTRIAEHAADMAGSDVPMQEVNVSIRGEVIGTRPMAPQALHR